MKLIAICCLLLLTIHSHSQEKSKIDTATAPGAIPMLEVNKTGVNLNGSVKIPGLAGQGKKQLFIDDNGTLSTDGGPTSEAVTGFYNVPPGSFTKTLSSTSSVLYNYANRSYMTSSATDILIAPVHLPHGATVKSIRILFLDNTESTLRVQFLSTEWAWSATVLAQIQTSGNSVYESAVTSPPLNIFINNETNYYSVSLSPIPGQTWMGSLLYLKAIIFTYEL
jgi:hypothetical protein